MARRQPPRAPKPFNPSLHVNLSGPFFKKDPEKTIIENDRQLMIGLASEGQKMARAGWSNSIRGAGGVVGRAHSLGGTPWVMHATVTPEFVYPWPNGAPKQYRGGKNKKRARAFRDARYRMIAAVKRLADLTKGLS